MDRPTVHEYFIDLAVLISSRSTCIRKQHGAVIVKDKQVLSTGYNGAPAGIKHCESCYREDNNIPHGTQYESCRSVHAEQNAIIQAARHGVSIEGAAIYITGIPCLICSRMIINAGIKNVYTLFDENESAFKDSIELLSAAGIKITKVY